ncbi:MAG: divalent-cation tolerance protein CutA [Candidatus Binataceae bacterium]|jgi:periplasmic divalent cation tolerance protein
MTKDRKPEARLILVTAPNQSEAGAIARALVGDRLAACVNVVGPIRSIYRWRGAVEDEAEYLLIIKTRASLYSRVERRVKALHSYEVPEVIMLPIGAGSLPYLNWLFDATEASPRKTAEPASTTRRSR